MERDRVQVLGGLDATPDAVWALARDFSGAWLPALHDAQVERPAVAGRIVDALPRADGRFEVLGGAGHVCNVEAPEGYNAPLVALVARVAGAGRAMSLAAASLRQTRRAEKEERILDAALVVFSSAGYAGASMDAIAEAAGVSKPTLYQYFGSKEALFARIMERGRDQMLEPFGAPGQAGAGMVARLHAFAWAYADFVMQPAFLSRARLVIGEVQRSPGLGRAYQAAGPGAGGHDRLS